MKKTTALLATLALLAGVLAIYYGATHVPASPANDAKNDKLKIVCTIFPEYDWVRQILGDKVGDVEITMLLDNGVDLHSYQPTADDIVKVSTCDMFVYVGGESDAWVKDALKEATNKNMVVIDLLDVLGDSAKSEEVVEGMEAEEHEHEKSEEHEHEEGEEHEHEEGPEYDEHVWLSLKNAQVFCSYIAQQLGVIDAENAQLYADNAKKYNAQLASLDAEYQATVKAAKFDTFVFGDRFPFRYLVDDYGLKYYAAFVGCSAETEASFETVAFLAKKVSDLGLKSVITIEGPEHKIAETIIKNTNGKDQHVLTMDSMQATTKDDVAKGSTYLSIMKNNLNVLMDALN